MSTPSSPANPPTPTGAAPAVTAVPARPSIGFRRSRSDRWIAGVCAGIAARTGLDVTLVRVIAVLLAIFGHLISLVAYIACWILVPEEDAPEARAAGPSAGPSAVA